MADTRTTKERIWQVRKAIPEATSFFYSRYTKEDLVVPTDRVPDLLGKIRDICFAANLEWVTYGHAGDGNMHCTVIGPPADNWHEVLRGVQEKIYSAVIEMGGTLSGEHGIGFKRKSDMKLFLDRKQIELIKRVKLAFDPTISSIREDGRVGSQRSGGRSGLPIFIFPCPSSLTLCEESYPPPIWGIPSGILSSRYFVMGKVFLQSMSSFSEASFPSFRMTKALTISPARLFFSPTAAAACTA